MGGLAGKDDLDGDVGIAGAEAAHDVEGGIGGIAGAEEDLKAG
jgi:hypothetical protein